MKSSLYWPFQWILQFYLEIFENSLNTIRLHSFSFSFQHISCGQFDNSQTFPIREANVFYTLWEYGMVWHGTICVDRIGDSKIIAAVNKNRYDGRKNCIEQRR